MFEKVFFWPVLLLLLVTVANCIMVPVYDIPPRPSCATFRDGNQEHQARGIAAVSIQQPPVAYQNNYDTAPYKSVHEDNQQIYDYNY